jgi:hypothetical protein
MTTGFLCSKYRGLNSGEWILEKRSILRFLPDNPKPNCEEFVMATIQNLKTDETVTSSNVNSDPNISGKLPEKETAYHSNSDEITIRRINGAPTSADVYSAVSEDNGELLDDTELESDVISFGTISVLCTWIFRN